MNPAKKAAIDAKAREIIGDYEQTHDVKAFFARLKAAFDPEMRVKKREPGEEG